MKLFTRLAMVSMMALATSACTAGDPEGEGDDSVLDGEDVISEGDDTAGTDANQEDVGEAEQAIECSWNYIHHYTYSDSTGTYRWDVSWNLTTGKRYVDERRIGGGFYKQYVLTPTWTVCPSSLESINLKSGLLNLNGPHNCLPDHREEVHLQDKQRVLTYQYTDVLCL